MAQWELWLVLLAVLALSARLGLGFYLSGMSQSKNAATAMTRTVADFCAAILAFWAVGHAILLGRPGAMLALDGSFGGAGVFMSAIVLIATGAMLGGILERTSWLAPLIAAGVLAGVIVPLAARWAWTGWLARLGFVDIGGAGALHVCGGVFAAVGAMVAGPRAGKYNHDGSTNLIPGHSFPQAAAGSLALAAGLLAQLIGCAILRNVSAAQAAADGLLAAAAGGLTGLLVGHVRQSIVDPHFVLAGLLGELVAASAGAGRLAPASAALIGVGAGLLVPWAIVWTDLRRKIDDPGSSIAIHLFGGLWGLAAAGLLLPGDVNRFRQVAVQALGTAAIVVLALAGALIVFLALKATVGLRSSHADEMDGSDLVEHDMNAYPDFQQTMIKSYHLRQT